MEGSAPVAVRVVDGVAVREQAHALDPVHLVVVAADGICEPAERAGAQPAEHDARLPGLAQHRVDSVGAPNPRETQQAASADVDQVLGE